MIKTQIYFPKSDLEALHRRAKATGKSVAALVREAVHMMWQGEPNHRPKGPIALWTGPVRRTSLEHDSIYDEL